MIETNKKSRTFNSMRNMVVSTSLLALSYLSNFIYRMFFIKFLSLDYLGVSTALTSVIAILSLTELGFGTAVCYFLYKPLGIDYDEDKVISIMNFIKKVYLVMACLTILLGLCMFPFLDRLVEPLNTTPNMKIIYWFLVAGNVISYIGANKSVILTADQKEFVNKTTYYLSKILSQVVIIILLYKVRNYWVVLISDLCFTIVQNVFIYVFVNKKYPFLKRKVNAKLQKDEVKNMVKVTGSMFVNKAGTVVLNSTDSLIISAMIGTVISGLYSNYAMVINAINALIYLLFSSITASVGNYVLKENRESSYELYRTINLIGCFLAAIAGLGIFFVSDSFITLWLGSDFVFDKSIVFVISLAIMFENFARANEMFLLPLNLVTKTVFWGIVYVFINLVSSIIFTKYYGLAGVFLGTVLARIVVFIAVAIILNKDGFNKSVSKYFICLAYYIMLVLLSAVCIYFSLKFTLVSKIADFVVKTIIVVLETSCIFFIFNMFTRPFKRGCKALPYKIRRYIDKYIQ